MTVTGEKAAKHLQIPKQQIKTALLHFINVQ